MTALRAYPNAFEVPEFAPDEVVRADAELMRELDSDASQSLNGEMHDAIFAALADFKECGLLKRFAEGDSVRDMSPAQLDVFARHARLSELLAGERQRQVDAEVKRRFV